MHLTYGWYLRVISGWHASMCIYPRLRSVFLCASVTKFCNTFVCAWPWYTCITALRRVLSSSLSCEWTHLISAVTGQIKGGVCKEVVSLKGTFPLQSHPLSSIIRRQLLCALLSFCWFTFFFHAKKSQRCLGKAYAPCHSAKHNTYRFIITGCGCHDDTKCGWKLDSKN